MWHTAQTWAMLPALAGSLLRRRCGLQVDPFVEMSVRDGRALRTKTIWNNKDPVFNQVLSFVVDDPEHQSITAMVKDDDMHAFAKVALCSCSPEFGTSVKV